MFYDLITKYTEKCELLHCKTGSHFFDKKNIGVSQILTSEILTNPQLTASLVLNNRVQDDSEVIYPKLKRSDTYNFNQMISVSFIKSKKYIK